MPGTEPLVIEITPAQNRVLRELLYDGASNQTIARRLHITENTVKTHFRFLRAATQMPDRTALALAVARGHVRVTVRKPKGEW